LCPTSGRAHARTGLTLWRRDSRKTAPGRLSAGAITVVIDFSLQFVRYRTFEAEGEWSLASLGSTALLALAVGLEFVALWRSLLPRDDDEPVYHVTLRAVY